MIEMSEFSAEQTAPEATPVVAPPPVEVSVVETPAPAETWTAEAAPVQDVAPVAAPEPVASPSPEVVVPEPAPVITPAPAEPVASVPETLAEAAPTPVPVEAPAPATASASVDVPAGESAAVTVTVTVDVDRIALMSLRADGTPDQSEGFVKILDED